MVCLSRVISFSAMLAVAFTTEQSAAQQNIQLKLNANLFNTKQEFRNNLNNNDFRAELANTQGIDLGFGTTIQLTGVGQMPALSQEGLFYALVTVQPCGIVVPHLHPRASELDFLVQGGPLRNVFAEEFPSKRVITYDMQPGQTGLLPQGLLHVQLNLGCNKMVFIAALSGEDPGIVAIGNSDVFPLSTSSKNSTSTRVRRLEAGLAETPLQTRDRCLQTCGINGNNQNNGQQNNGQQNNGQQNNGQQPTSSANQQNNAGQKPGEEIINVN